jgi:toxin secretion/phage lysis holin
MKGQCYFMETIWDKLLKAAVAIGGTAASVLGGWDWILTVFLCFMVMDYLSGVIVGIIGKSLKSKTGGLSSKAGVQGLLRKGLMIMVVLLAALLDRAVGTGATVVRDLVCWFYIANEGISIMENLTIAGVPFPKKLKVLFEEKLGEDEKSSAGDENDTD